MDADLQSAIIAKANLQKTFLGFVKLQNATLYQCDLENSDFWRANLSNVILKWSDMKNSILVGTNFEGASLEWCNLEGASLRGYSLNNKEFVYLPPECDENWQQYIPSNAIPYEAEFNDETILPDGTKWTKQTDMRRFTDREHPDFWSEQVDEQGNILWYRKEKYSENN
ncbi:MAG: pentapeptide repeat-containing protein [Chloroflexota bacterium]